MRRVCFLFFAWSGYLDLSHGDWSRFFRVVLMSSRIPLFLPHLWSLFYVFLIYWCDVCVVACGSIEGSRTLLGMRFTSPGSMLFFLNAPLFARLLSALGYSDAAQTAEQAGPDFRCAWGNA